LTANWKIDPRLESDTFIIHPGKRLEIRLMNDSRWPWIMVVPAITGLCDLDEFPKDGLTELSLLLHDLSGTLKDMGVCTSTNVATLSNVVTQMHWHVVGRNEGDANWPGPVWGFEKALAYGRDDADRFISDFKKVFRGTFV
jgi:diadenosine tetraphosphate (Ap4A) HIT family hydrolase